MAKTKLLITTDNFLPRWDGIARTLTEVIPSLSRKYSITVICPKFSGKVPKYNGVKIVRMELSKLHFGDYNISKFQSKKIASIIKKNNIVFNQTIGPIGLNAIRLAKKLKVPVTTYIHSIEWELFSKAVKRFKKVVKNITKIAARIAYNKCDLLMIPSNDVRKLMRDNKIKTKTEVVQLGTSISRFSPVKNKDLAKKKLGIDPGDLVIGYCGRIGREKGVDTLYAAFEKLKHTHGHIKLLIVGSGVKSIEEFLEDREDVILAGKQDNVVPYLNAMDIYVLPSLTETTSISTIEAMSCKLPVVVTPVGYVRKYVEEGINGVFFPKKNSGVLAKKLRVLLDDASLRNKLGRNARKTIVHKFNWKKTIKGIEDALESVLEKSEHKKNKGKKK